MSQNIPTRTITITDEEIIINQITEDIIKISCDNILNLEGKNKNKYLKINCDMTTIMLLIDRKIYLQAYYELEKLHVWIIENVEPSEKSQKLHEKMRDLKILICAEYPKNHKIIL